MNSITALSAEKGLIGSVLLDGAQIATALGKLSPSQFESASLGLIYEKILELHKNGKILDALILSESLGEDMKKIGGDKIIVDCLDSVLDPTAAREYVDCILANWRRRQLRKLLHDGEKKLQDSGYASALASIRSQLIDLGRESEESGLKKMSALTPDWFEEFEAIRENPALLNSRYLKTGFLDFDRIYGGLPHGMAILAARPAMGKTALALNIATNVARGGGTVLFFSLEMTAEQVIQRIMASLSRIDSRRLERGEIEEEEMPGCISALAEASDLPIFINDSCKDLGSILEQIKQFTLGNGRPDLVVIDYLGLVDAGRQDERENATTVAKQVGLFATQELKGPILVLCQLNRGVESRNNKRPILSDLRDSGEIEQSAARVDMLFRESYYEKLSPTGNLSELISVKNRFGPTETIKLYFQKQTTTFCNYAGE